MKTLFGLVPVARLTSITTALVLGALVSTASTGNAQTPASIKEKGTLVVGVQADQIPWGFIDEKGQNAGYDVEIAKMVADELGVKIEYVRVTVASRIAALLTGKVDLLAAVMGMYPDRAKVIQFTKPYSKHDIIVIGKKSDVIKDMADLANPPHRRDASGRAGYRDYEVGAPQHANSEVRRRFNGDPGACVGAGRRDRRHQHQPDQHQQDCARKIRREIHHQPSV